MRVLRISLLLVVASIVMGQDGCTNADRDPSGSLDPTPEKLDGSPSSEFERSDLERARNATPEVQAYCEDAVSEAQRLGCLSHVDPSEIP